MTEPPTDADLALLERTRSAVMNVLVVVGLGIGLSGFLLGRRERGAWLLPPPESERVAYGSLLILGFASLFTRRVLGSRAGLREPTTRAARFYRGHVLGAAIAAVAIPLGFAYGWFVRPRLDGVWPFWVVALALTTLALPREVELDGFDRPLPPPPADLDPPAEGRER